MSRNRGKRSGFTIIELLVVILIIAVLVGLVSSAALKALGELPKVRTAVEISELQNGMAKFMLDYQLTDPPPSVLYIHEDGSYNVVSNPLDKGTVAFFQKCFSRNFNPLQRRDWNGNGVIDPPYILQGQQCLVFYLGGIPSYTTSGSLAMTGFGMAGVQPDAASVGGPLPLLYATAGTPLMPGQLGYASPGRKGPYFNFDNSRVANDPRCPGFPVYQDPWQSHKRNVSPLLPQGADQPYAYFSNNGVHNGYLAGDCATIGAFPYYQGFIVGTIPPRPSYVNPDGYQILSAGLDGVFAYDVGGLFGVSWSPMGGFGVPPAVPGMDTSKSIAGNDDQTNFTAGLAGAGEQR